MGSITAGYDGIADGTAFTAASSDDNGDTASGAPTTTGGTFSFSTAQSSHGTGSLLTTVTGTGNTFVPYSDPAAADVSTGTFAADLYMTGSPSGTTDYPIRFVTSANATVFTIQMTATRLLRISAGSTAQMTTGTTLTTFQRIEVTFDSLAGGSGVITCTLYPRDSTSAIDTISLTGLTIANTVRGFRLGRMATATITDWAWDDVRYVSGISTSLGPVTPFTQRPFIAPGPAAMRAASW